jgi:transcriptional regulator GlxA family with amidase domain
VSSLARWAGLSDRTFARRFVAETGTTPHRWLTNQRVLLARRLLEESDLGVEQVAVQSGFGTAALLRHHFKGVVGVSPVEYRRRFSQRSA